MAKNSLLREIEGILEKYIPEHVKCECGAEVETCNADAWGRMLSEIASAIESVSEDIEEQLRLLK